MGWGAEMISMSRRAPKDSMWETMLCWLGGGPVGGRNWANWVRPKAVRMEAILIVGLSKGVLVIKRWREDLLGVVAEVEVEGLI